MDLAWLRCVIALISINRTNKIIALPISRLLLGEAPAAAGDEGTPRTLCSHLLFLKMEQIRRI